MEIKFDTDRRKSRPESKRNTIVVDDLELEDIIAGLEALFVDLRNKHAHAEGMGLYENQQEAFEAGNELNAIKSMIAKLKGDY